MKIACARAGRGWGLASLVALGAGCQRAEAPQPAPTGSTAIAADTAANRQAPTEGDAAAPSEDDAAELALPSEPPPAAAEVSAPALPAPAMLRWIAAGGGSGPDDNQVQLESDLALATRRLGPGGVILFAGGPGTRAVQVEDDEARSEPSDAVLARLGELLDPRGGRAARYRPTTLALHGEATVAALEDWLARALGDGAPTEPLTLFIAGHGGPGAVPAETPSASTNTVSFWGGDALTPPDLAEVLGPHPSDVRPVGPVRPGRPVRIIMTSCYSGAFADLVFRGADPTAGPAEPLRCGFFATSEDRVASGCDPDPERQAAEGYALHFFAALAREDKDGRPLAAPDVDFDGDGRVSFAEAHARVRIATRGFDVPTSTSARWLAVAVPRVPSAERSGQAPRVPLPEEDAVVKTLSHRLGAETLVAARREMDRLDRERERAAQAERDAVDDEDRLARIAIGRLLSRWPELADPWHPAFARVFGAARPAVAEWLRADPAYQAFRAASEQSLTAAERADAATLAEAPWERLVDALETRARAEFLAAQGGNGLATLERILACERGGP